MNPREEIIGLLRGQVACPVISCLGELGWLERMTDTTFDHTSFVMNVDIKVFKSVMRYMASLQLVQRCDDGAGFVATPLGKTVFRRYGAFCILNSYEDHMHKLRSMLVPDGSRRAEVNRARNVIGSGALHERKFFVPALRLLDSSPCQFIADIGCGDGNFLHNCHRRFPEASILAVDLSSIAVEATLRRLRETARITGIVADGADIHAWSRHVPQETGGGSLISMWFLVHEISRSDPQVVREFFHLLHEQCPDASVLMGEVVRIPPDILAHNRSASVLPELTLLHDLSRQGLLSWSEWQHIASRIPYTRAAELKFDLVCIPGDTQQPSSFVWWLTPH